MKLTSLEIEDYKSIKKLTWNLDQNITCLVGQNESGKSNLIEVLELLNQEKIGLLSFEEHTNRSSDRYLNAEIPLVIATYKLNDTIKKILKEKLKTYITDETKLDEIKLFESFIIRSKERKEKEDDLGSGNYYFENDELYYPLSYLVANKAHIKTVIGVLDSLKTSVIRLEDDYIDSFELTIQQVTTNALPNAALIKLMKLAGVSDLTKIPTEHKSLNRYLKRLNNKLNINFTNKYYSQDASVELNIVHNSSKLFLEIADETEAEYAIHERSDGFKYFFGLLIEAASINDSEIDIVFLLDEPGSKLHPSGQKDLLKYLEELSTTYRVIYTTHSPFLINRLFPNRVRIIERDKRNGTIFKFKGFSKNWYPMRSALGLSISDSFYYCEKALLVEGPEDIIYIGALINLFTKYEEINIKTDIFSFIDAGGEGNLPSMIQIMIEEERPIMVLMDSDSQKTYNKIDKKRKSLKSGMLVLNQINDFRTMAVSIEDLLPKEILTNSLNNYLKELLEDESLVPIKNRQLEIKKIKEDNSIYKNEICGFIKENFKNPSKSDTDWTSEKVPISKVGIARHFEKIISDSDLDYEKYKADFKSSLKLVKLVVEKLKLKD